MLVKLKDCLKPKTAGGMNISGLPCIMLVNVTAGKSSIQTKVSVLPYSLTSVVQLPSHR